MQADCGDEKGAERAQHALDCRLEILRCDTAASERAAQELSAGCYEPVGWVEACLNEEPGCQP